MKAVKALVIIQISGNHEKMKKNTFAFSTIRTIVSSAWLQVTAMLLFTKHNAVSNKKKKK